MHVKWWPLVAEPLEHQIEVRYDLGYMTPEALQGGKYGVAGGLPASFTKAYREGHIALHVHFARRTADTGETGECCAVFERTFGPLDRNDTRAVGCHQVERRTGQEDGSSNEQNTMLVEPVEVIKDRQRREFGRFWLCHKRLMCLDDCLGEVGEVLYPTTSLIGIERRVYVDRKRGSFAVGSDRHGEGADDVVERGGEIVNGITDDEAEFRRRIVADVYGQEQLVCLHIGLTSECVWLLVDEPLDSLLYRFQVFVGPR